LYWADNQHKPRLTLGHRQNSYRTTASRVNFPHFCIQIYVHYYIPTLQLTAFFDATAQDFPHTEVLRYPPQTVFTKTRFYFQNSTQLFGTRVSVIPCIHRKLRSCLRRFVRNTRVSNIITCTTYTNCTKIGQEILTAEYKVI
jgi:hypothetical protein